MSSIRETKPNHPRKILPKRREPPVQMTPIGSEPIQKRGRGRPRKLDVGGRGGRGGRGRIESRASVDIEENSMDQEQGGQQNLPHERFSHAVLPSSGTSRSPDTTARIEYQRALLDQVGTDPNNMIQRICDAHFANLKAHYSSRNGSGGVANVEQVAPVVDPFIPRRLVGLTREAPHQEDLNQWGHYIDQEDYAHPDASTSRIDQDYYSGRSTHTMTDRASPFSVAPARFDSETDSDVPTAHTMDFIHHNSSRAAPTNRFPAAPVQAVNATSFSHTAPAHLVSAVADDPAVATLTPIGLRPRALKQPHYYEITHDGYLYALPGKPNVGEWTADDVADWLSMFLIKEEEQAIPRKFFEHGVDGEVLRDCLDPNTDKTIMRLLGVKYSSFRDIVKNLKIVENSFMKAEYDEQRML